MVFFISTTYFTENVKEVALEGNMTVTLIDGQELIKLVEKHKLHITPVITYEFDDYYYEEE